MRQGKVRCGEQRQARSGGRGVVGTGVLRKVRQERFGLFWTGVNGARLGRAGIVVAGTERKVGTGQDWKGPYWQARCVKAVRGKIRSGELRSGRQAREEWQLMESWGREG